MNNMFCFQCEQTAKGIACDSSAGVCGKTAEVANLQDEVIEQLIKIAYTNKTLNDEVIKFVTDALFLTITNVNFDEDDIKLWIAKAQKFIPEDNLYNFNMRDVWTSNEDIRSLKSLVLFGLKGIAAYAHHARTLKHVNQEVDLFMFTALKNIALLDDADSLLKLVLETGRINLLCMETLNNANVNTYGKPQPTKVNKVIEKGPFIVITGHDLHDLENLLKATENTGISIYTHSEMLPAHAYPELNKYPHLKGNFGTAWQSQQKEFADVPGAFLFTTNCLMPIKDSYGDRVFTMHMVGQKGTTPIKDNDFTPIINRALELGGYADVVQQYGINGGTELTTGFGKDVVLENAAVIIDAVKAGDIKHFFLIGGCDGAKAGRNYYTDFVKQTPKDTIILTLACGKYRFNDLNAGEIGPFPRILDMGQCNDAYSAIMVAVELAKAFECEVNELPLSMILSWYEQKAVSILLTLLYLGIKDIYLGPTLPAFVSENVLNILVENYNIRPISTPENDLKNILG